MGPPQQPPVTAAGPPPELLALLPAACLHLLIALQQPLHVVLQLGLRQVAVSVEVVCDGHLQLDLPGGGLRGRR